MAANWPTRRRLHGEAEDGAEDEEDEDQLEAEHGPVAGAPHAPGHDPHDQRRRQHLGEVRLLAVDLDPGEVADDDRERDQRRRRRRRSSPPAAARPRPAAPALRAPPGCAPRPGRSRAPSARAASRAGAALLALARRRSATGRRLAERRRRRCAQRFGRRGGVGGVADRPHDAEPPRPGRDDLRGVATGRCRRSRRRGGARCAAAWETSSRPTAGRPCFRRRLPDRPDADVVDRALGAGGDLLLGVGREADDRVGPEQLPRLARRRRRPGRRGRRRRRRRGPGRGRR